VRFNQLLTRRKQGKWLELDGKKSSKDAQREGTWNPRKLVKFNQLLTHQDLMGELASKDAQREGTWNPRNLG
jgi:hypothetical protein